MFLWYMTGPAAKDVELSATHTDTVVQSVGVSEFSEAVSDSSTILLDVRTPSEFAAGHITGAQNFDFYNPEFHQMIDALDRTQPYAVYCRSGSRTSQTLVLMRSLGFTNVTELSGGVIAWQRAGNSLCQLNQC